MEVRVMQDILGKNNTEAAKLREEFAKRGIFALNLMGSPGAGKTTLLETTLKKLSEKIKIFVIEGDLFTTKDADRIEKTGIPVAQINTGGGCHLEALMVSGVLDKLGETELVIIENVGNLVCPAEFDIGEDEKAVAFSVAEGDDKPLKYPLIFKESSAIVINKTDLLPYTDFNIDSARADIMALNPGVKIFPVSCKTAEGVDEWCEWILEKVKTKKLSINLEAR